MTAERPNPDPPLDDEIPRSQQIERLFVEHNEALLRFLTARTGSAQDARDVAQEAYVRLLRLDQPGTIGYLRAYLYSTAANLVKDRAKIRRRQQQASPLLFFNREEESSTPSPEPSWVASERLQIIMQAIDELPSLCRAAFILRKYDGLALDDIALQLKVNVRTIKRYIARAMEHCEARLKAAGDTLKELP